MLRHWPDAQKVWSEADKVDLLKQVASSKDSSAELAAEMIAADMADDTEYVCGVYSLLGVP